MNLIASCINSSLYKNPTVVPHFIKYNNYFSRMAHFFIYVFLWISRPFSTVTGSSLFHHLLFEFSECRIDIILNTNIVRSKYVEDIPLAHSPTPVTLMAVGSEMRKAMRRLRESNFSRNQPCELVLSNWTTSEPKYVRLLTNYFEWISLCGFDYWKPIGSEPLCFSKHLYYVFIRYGQSEDSLPYNVAYPEPIFEITLNSDDTIVARALPTAYFCYTSASTRFQSKNYSEIYIRDFLDESQWLIFESACRRRVSGAGMDSTETFTPLPQNNESIHAKKVRILLYDLFRSKNMVENSSVVEFDRMVFDNDGTWFKLNLPSNLYRKFSNPDSYNALIKQTRFNFVTCHNDFYISLLALVSPFQYSMWGCVLSMLGLSAIFLYIYALQHSMSIGPTFLIVRLIFDQEVSEVQKRDSPLLRVFSVFLCMTWFLITNVYRGKVTTNLTAPPPPYQMKSIEEAVERDFKVLLHYEPGVPLFKTGNEMLRKTVIEYTIKYGWVLYISSMHRAIQENPEIARKHNATFQKILSQQFIFKGSDVMDQFVESEFCLCNQTILIGETVELSRFVFRVHFKNPDLTVYEGQERILGINLNWEFVPTFWDKSDVFKHRFDSYSTSGILQNQFLGKVNERILQKPHPKPMKLKSNFASLLIIYIIFILFSTLVFCTEKILYWYTRSFLLMRQK